MRKLARPTETVADVIALLRSETPRAGVHQDLDEALPVLTARETIYNQNIEDNTAFQIPRDSTISARVEKKKMVDYYEYRLRDNPRGGDYYDKLLQSIPGNTCPYCTIKEVKTIDHFLPKSEYPSYSVTPNNLVPSCTDCNIDKKISYPTSADDQTFHPYFDKVDNICWIKAELIQNEPLSFQFSVIQPADWNENKFNRATAHFIGYNINQLFCNGANRDLRGAQYQLKNLFLKDRDSLRSHLEDTYISNRNGLGILDWKTLMYQELSTNAWFLNGCPGNNYFV
jgi:5-methylcytosine-specific restriction endonuclease McrA